MEESGFKKRERFWVWVSERCSAGELDRIFKDHWSPNQKTPIGILEIRISPRIARIGAKVGVMVLGGDMGFAGGGLWLMWPLFFNF
jgi:hypothetical protein